MKILLVIPWFLPNKGGAEIGAFEMARELVRRGHDVRVATIRYRWDWPKRETIDGIQIVRLPVLGWKAFPALSELAYTIAPFFSLGRVMDQFKPDVVHMHYTLFTGYAASFFARRRGLPTVLTLVGNDVYDPYRIPCSYLLPFTRKVLHRASQVVAACTFIRRAIHKRFNLPEDRVQVIPYGVNLDKFNVAGLSPSPPDVVGRVGEGRGEGGVAEGGLLRQKLGIPDGAPFILTVQRLHERKGVRFALEAAEIILKQRTDLRLVIVGDGTERAKLEAFCTERGIADRVIFTGRAPLELLVDLYVSCELFAFHTLHEGFGIVCLEAMACGKAVVTTRAGGTEDIVEEGKTGLMVEPARPREFAEAVLKLLADAPLREQMGRAGLARVQEFYAWPRIVDKYEAFYRRLVNSEKTA